ncbi:MAG: hypothetical protein HZB99_03835 [Candidatus Harrisonbacteria bacterium]|nr:hypothetical protein [Candidatus Harrisonbacteria bacterium]
MMVKDPLDLSPAEIRKYRKQIIQTLIKYGRSRERAVKSADRWEKALLETKLEFMH